MSLGDSLNLAAMHAVVAPALSRPARYRHCSSCAPPLLFFLLAQWVPNKVSATSVHVHVVADTATFGDGTGPLQWARGGAAGHAGTVAKYPIPQPPKGEHYLNKIYERSKASLSIPLCIHLHIYQWQCSKFHKHGIHVSLFVSVSYPGSPFYPSQ